MDRMSPQVSRFAAVGLLALIILGAVFYALVPLTQGYINRTEEVAIQTKRLATLRGLLANEAQVDEELKRLDSLNTSGDIFLKGNKPAIASAKLREFVSDIVKESGGSLVSTQEYQTQSLDTASAVGLRIQFNGETSHLTSLLYKLENARPLIFIDEITVTSSAAQRNSRGRSRARSATRRPTRMSLTVKLDIFGYMVTGEAPEPPEKKA